MTATLRAHPTLWLMRLLWLVMPWSVGAAAADALSACSEMSARILSAELWAAWALVLTAAFVRRPWALTVVRICVPASIGVAVGSVVAAAAWDADLAAPRAAAAIAGAAIATAVALLPETGNSIVDGLSYGNERRMLLRTPFLLAVAPVPLVWAAVVAGTTTPLVLWAIEQWIWAAVATVTGFTSAVLGFRSLHQLARRWVVFVPNGFVLHDRMATREPFLLRRADIASLGPAPADIDLGADDLADVSGNALGPVLLVTLDGQVEVVPRTTGTAQVMAVSRVLFSPTRPGEVLSEAARRRIPR
ncbi:hypothetical protein [Candidatus Poriferisodalis sp.]|uniref:hypothetical protein n=1 Tax=Candidatus Poriferisodalis sp. TaxID=3101277 RepID=UPI003B59CB38